MIATQCVGLSMANLSINFIGLDIALLLSFILLARLKYASALLEKCSQSTTPTHHCSSKNLSSSRSMHANSISILSESSKTFLTLPGQISLSKMLDSPKIYPSPHRSSSTYGRGCNPSMHLYESPKHLYKFGCDHYTFRHSNGNSIVQPPPPPPPLNSGITSYQLNSARTNLYQQRANNNSHLPPSSPLEPNSSLETNAYLAHNSDCAQSLNSHNNQLPIIRTNMNSTIRHELDNINHYRSHLFNRANFFPLN